jgi:peptidoglycan/LPS O-acetylase OafA/YrhL
MSLSQNAPSTRLHGLDTLRAAAIIAVVFYHFDVLGLLSASLSPLAEIGWIGVDLFFVLSGFLIGTQLLKSYLTGRKPSLKDFYRRRAYRILPAFFVVLLLYIFMPLWREYPDLYAPWQYVIFAWNLLHLDYPHSHVFSHVWSLCVEEHFYLIFPLMLIALMRKPSVAKTVSVLLLLVLGGIGLRTWILYAFVRPATDQQGFVMMKDLYYPTYTRLDGLVVGVSLSALRSFRPVWWARFTRHGWLLAIFGIVFVVGSLWLCDFSSPAPDLPFSLILAFPGLSCGFGLLVASAVSETGFLRTRVPGASWLATLAFSIYLTHKSVAHATHRLLPNLTAQTDWKSLAIYTVTCLTVASLLYFGIERPFILLRMRRDHNRASTAVDKEVRLDPAI